MGRLAATLGALSGLLLVPLALSRPTAVLVVPGHLAFCVMVCAGAVIEGFLGYPERARLWGFGYLVLTTLVVAALELGATSRGLAWTYWGIPWSAILVWGWIPPVVAGVAGVAGHARQHRLARGAVRRRHAASPHDA